jgi:hypothetical protein
MGKESFLQGPSPRRTETATASSGSPPRAGHPQDVELELERLRAERDAMAAELQIERAERLRAEERLRLFEREKLEQMREGAASREKLASELEEARLRAMRAEARQAALEADTRLAEIESRRRGGPWVEGDLVPLPEELAEPTDPRSEPEFEAGSGVPGPTETGGRAIPLAGPPVRERSGPERPGPGSASHPPPRRPVSGATEPPSASRLSDASPPPRARTDGRASATRASHAPPAAPPAGSGAARSAASKNRHRPPDVGAKRESGASSGGAAGRPAMDRAHLETRLGAGARWKTTERFRQFQPVSQNHIKMCDWLGQAKTLAQVEALAGGKLTTEDIMSVLVLFFERSFLVLE